MADDLAKTLAIHGGTAVRTDPWPTRNLLGEDEKRAVMDLFDRAAATGAPFTYGGSAEEAYCKAFAAMMGGGFADGVNSGTNAIYVALRAVDPQPGTEVIVPAMSDPGGVMPVAIAGCIPVPADTAPAPGSTPGSFNVGAAQIAARITERTSAIIVAHIGGLPCDMDAIMALASKRGLPVIEDCAQAHGATCRGKPVGTFGDVAAFSTMSGKHHVTGGQGGVVFTRDEQMYWRIRRAADRGKPFGLEGVEENVVAALNCNMDEMQAAIGCVQLPKLAKCLAARRRNAAALAEGCRRKLKAVRVVEALPGCEGAYWFIFCTVDVAKLRVDKNAFVDALAAEGIPVGKSYLVLPCEHRWYREQFGGGEGRSYPCPNVHAADRVTFRLLFHEKCGDAEVADTLAAMAKVEAAYLK